MSCFHSYAHFVLARERGIKYWSITSGRLPRRVAVYSQAPQMPEQLDRRFHDLQERGLSATERELAESYVTTFRDRPTRPTGMDTRAKQPKIERGDAARIADAAARYFADRDNPTAIPPWRAVKQRLLRMTRVVAIDVLEVFEQPVEGERYVLYPIHLQPEASTLVQAPMYVDQVALLRDIAASLPIGLRLYVKEHVSNRGRRPLEFYEAIREIPSVRLLGPDTNTWSLIQNASAVAVITGTMGWEALLFERPVITFGKVFYNHHPSVLRASEAPKDRWFELFTKATTSQVIDREATLAMVTALHQVTHPGFIGNPSSFPEVVEATNIEQLVNALAVEIGLN